jgi:hypothetical protein
MVSSSHCSLQPLFPTATVPYSNSAGNIQRLGLLYLALAVPTKRFDEPLMTVTTLVSPLISLSSLNFGLQTLAGQDTALFYPPPRTYNPRLWLVQPRHDSTLLPIPLVLCLAPQNLFSKSLFLSCLVSGPSPSPQFLRCLYNVICYITR